jgi:hypothetical protein
MTIKTVNSKKGIKVKSEKKTENNSPNPEIVDYLESIQNRINNNINLVEGESHKTKVYCKEPYAQKMYDMYTGHTSADVISKDLTIGEIYEVSPITINMNERNILCDEVKSGTPVIVTFQDYTESLQDLSI